MATKSWRDTLPIHPAAELFSCAPVSPDEKRALGEDIIKNGLTSPIVLWKPDRKSPECLFDGITRLDAIEIATGCPAIVGAPSITAGEDFLARDRVITLDSSVDPYAYVISANIHRRHLTTEQKRDLIGKLIKTDPSKSDRQIAETTKTDHKTVASVRAEKEARGEIPHVSTRTDSKGRKQLAKKSSGPKTGRKKMADLAPQVSAEVQEQRAAAAERIRALLGRNKPDHQDDISPDSVGETERLRARNEELENENTRLRHENLALRGEIEELKARLTARHTIADDND